MLWVIRRIISSPRGQIGGGSSTHHQEMTLPIKRQYYRRKRWQQGPDKEAEAGQLREAVNVRNLRKTTKIAETLG